MNQDIKKDYFWNTLSYGLYSAVSALLSVFVIKTIGKLEGGIFSFGFSTLANQIYTISYFGLKTPHCIDVEKKFSFKEYLLHRYCTSLISLIIGIVYILIMFILQKNDAYKSIILSILIWHGVLEGFFDVYESEYQRNNKLYIAGQALFFRTFIWTSIFLLLLITTRNITFSTIVGMIVKFTIGYIFVSEEAKNIFYLM